MKKVMNALALALIVCFILPIAAACEKQEQARTKYEIVASYDEATRTLSGSVTVDYLNSSEAVLDEVCFHLYPSAFREGARFSAVPKSLVGAAYYDGLGYGGIEVGEVTVDGATIEAVVTGQDEDILSVPVGEIYPGEAARIGVNFVVTLPKARHRLGVTENAINFGNFYPIACVYENGAFRVDPYYENGDPFYSDCADYTVKLTLPARLTLAASGTIETTKNGEFNEHTCKIENARDFAAVAGEFKMIGTKACGVDVNYYYYADEAPEKSLVAAADALKTFTSEFGEYPYPAYSVVETGFLQGGMEYPALSLVTDTLNPSAYLDAIVHETAHQWWYGAVGNDEINCAWMDEGLAEFSSSLFFEKNPSYGVDGEKRLADALSSYVVYFDPSRPSPRSDVMTRALNEYRDGFEYAYSTYVKGELLFTSLRQTIGDEAFFSALKTYYSKYKFKNASPDELIACFCESSSRDVKPFFSAWLDGKVKAFA